jgi:hypothetical protein
MSILALLGFMIVKDEELPDAKKQVELRDGGEHEE